MNVDRVIHHLKRRLTWTIREETGTNPNFEIVSSHHHREHVIIWPRPNSSAGPPRPIEYAHELAHAYLAERVHHLLAGSAFTRGTDESLLPGLAVVFRTTTDWFADGVLMELCPEAEKKEIEEHAELALKTIRQNPHGDAQFLFMAALMIAQARRWLGVHLECGGQLAEAVQALLDTPPLSPTVEAAQALTNRLLAIVSPYRVRLLQDGPEEVWELYEAKADDGTTRSANITEE